MKWPIVELDEVAELHAGIGFPPALQGRTTGEIPFAKVGDISKHGRRRSKYLEIADNYVTKTDLATLRARPVVPGSTVFAKIGEAIRHNHRVIAAREILIDNNAMAATPKPGLDADYLYRFLQSVDLYRLATSTTVPSLRKTALQRIPLPYPPLDEQRRIAEILDCADALREKRNEVVAQIDKLAEAVFNSAFGTKLRSPTTTLGEVADIASGITKGRKTAEPTRLIPYLAVANVQAGHLSLGQVKEIEATDREIERYALAAGDIVLTEGGDPDKLGRGTVWREELPLCLHQNHIFRVRMRDDQLDPDYLSAYLASKPAKNYFLRSAKQTTGIASINMSQLRGTPIYVPSRSEQERYSTGINEIRSLRRAALIEAASLDELFASLQSRAFASRL